MTAPEGTVYVTTDGSDPREVGGELAAQAVAVEGGRISVSSDVVLTSRVLHDGEWSALVRASFTVR